MGRTGEAPRQSDIAAAKIEFALFGIIHSSISVLLEQRVLAPTGRYVDLTLLKCLPNKVVFVPQPPGGAWLPVSLTTGAYHRQVDKARPIVRAHWISQLHPNRLVAILAGASAMIVCACGVVIIWVLNISAVSLDRATVQGDTRLLYSVIGAQESALSKSVGDYAAWTELYEYLQGPRQLQWEADNLGPYLAKAFGVDHVFVVRRDGTIRYAYASASTAAAAPLSAATRRMLFDAAARAFADARSDRQVAVVGVIDLNGTPSLLAAAAIRRSAITGYPDFVLVEARELSGSYLASIGANYALHDLRALPDHGTGLPLIAPTGMRSGYVLSWSSAQVGRDLFERVLPTVVVFGTAAWFAMVGLGFVAWRIMEIIRAGEMRTLEAVVESSRAQARAAEETSRSKSAFIASMSHELRTPLNAIIGFSEFIISEALGPIGIKRYQEYALDIRDSGHHLLNLVNEILQASKIEAGKYQPRIECLAVVDAVHDSVRITQVLAAKKAIRMNVRVEPLCASVLADRQALQQILINVLSNAIKFSGDASVVDISGVVRDSRYELKVSDQGCGIPPATLKEIGRPFVQAEDAYRRTHQGTGLGLAISFRLAEAMHGAVKVSSSVGQGTTVTIGLPLAMAEQTDAVQTAA